MRSSTFVAFFASLQYIHISYRMVNKMYTHIIADMEWFRKQQVLIEYHTSKSLLARVAQFIQFKLFSFE